MPRLDVVSAGSTEPITLKETVVKHPYLFDNPRLQLPLETEGSLRKKAISHECLTSIDDDAPVMEDSTAGEFRSQGLNIHSYPLF